MRAFTWPFALIFWVAFVWAFWPEFAVVQKAKSSDVDRWSLQVILIVNQLAMLLAFASVWIFRSATMPAIFFWIGTAVLIAGSLLRRHCFRVLGKFFDGAVKVQSDHVVVDQGAYRWVRHPSYTGGMMMFMGIGMALTNWVSFVASAVLPMIAYAYRVRVEERALAESIGEPYCAYMRTHKRFVPYLV